MTTSWKFLFYLLLLTFLRCRSNEDEKYFTGTVDYSYTYSSDSLNADSLALLRTSAGRFDYDSTGYKSYFTGRDTLTYYYSGKRNRCITQYENGERQCEDYSQLTDSVLSVRMYDTDEKVLGYTCRVLEIQKGSSLVRYYVSTGLKIAPATYTRHRSYNWDTYGKEADGGLILKMEHIFPRFTMHGIATAVRIMPGSFRAFEIPDSEWAELCGE